MEKKDEVEIEKNKENTEKEWNPKDGFQILKQRIMYSITYAMFLGKSISDDGALNMFIVVVAHVPGCLPMPNKNGTYCHQTRSCFSTHLHYKAKQTYLMSRYNKLFGSIWQQDGYV